MKDLTKATPPWPRGWDSWQEFYRARGGITVFEDGALLITQEKFQPTARGVLKDLGIALVNPRQDDHKFTFTRPDGTPIPLAHIPRGCTLLIDMDTHKAVRLGIGAVGYTGMGTEADPFAALPESRGRRAYGYIPRATDTAKSKLAYPAPIGLTITLTPPIPNADRRFATEWTREVVAVLKVWLSVNDTPGSSYGWGTPAPVLLSKMRATPAGEYAMSMIQGADKTPSTRAFFDRLLTSPSVTLPFPRASVSLPYILAVPTEKV